MRYEIIFSGIGGQGMILCGKIAAEAASIFEKKHSVQTVYYGPESRGGVAESFAVISHEPVDYPKITEADALIALSQSGLDRHLDKLKDDAVVFVDEEKVDVSGVNKNVRIYKAPFTKISVEVMARPLAANIVALGMFSGATGKISAEACESAIKNNVPRGTEDKNISAFRRGVEQGEHE